MEVILARNFNANGVLYKRDPNGGSIAIPDGLRSVLPSSAKVVEKKVLGVPSNVPLDSRPKPGSGDPNANLEDRVQKVPNPAQPGGGGKEDTGKVVKPNPVKEAMKAAKAAE